MRATRAKGVHPARAAAQTTAPARPSRSPAVLAIERELEPYVIEDGKPVDSIITEKNMRLLTEPLHGGWSAPDNQPFVVLANVGVFHTRKQPPIVPDVLLAVGVTQGADLSLKQNLSYFVWLRGKVPDVALEIVSNREGGEDTDKQAIYRRIGVPYYVIFDPDDELGGGVLRVFERLKGRYRRLKEPFYFKDLGVGLRLWKGCYGGLDFTWLRWCDKEGNVIPTGAERADAERERADEALKELARLRAKLRKNAR